VFATLRCIRDARPAGMDRRIDARQHYSFTAARAVTRSVLILTPHSARVVSCSGRVQAAMERPCGSRRMVLYFSGEIREAPPLKPRPSQHGGDPAKAKQREEMERAYSAAYATVAGHLERNAGADGNRWLGRGLPAGRIGFVTSFHDRAGRQPHVAAPITMSAERRDHCLAFRAPAGHACPERMASATSPV